ncbi:beta-3-deoxy-D-manno-oct-2-ulosonic acid transferase [Segnochrobactraceae bacterium EtOH-i3]
MTTTSPDRPGAAPGGVDPAALLAADLPGTPGAPIHCYGFTGWKRGSVAAFFGEEGVRITHHLGGDAALTAAEREGGRLLVWGQKASRAFEMEARRAGVAFARVEDGFLRSVGLGSDLMLPASLVCDPVGMYYDATRPSRLELLLEHGSFSPELLARAARLRAAVVGAGLTKYNLGGTDYAPLLAAAAGRPIVVAVGQVANDASIRLAAPVLATNLALLRSVRSIRPDAFVVFKEHPDVASHNRPGWIADRDLRGLADHVVRVGDMNGLIAIADEIHTLCSLTGFEALLRGKPVMTWGLPFYAGWGLTDDRLPVPRRHRAVSLDMLVAATLILYPRYVDPATGERCEAEDIVARIAAARGQRTAWPDPGPIQRLRRLIGRAEAFWQHHVHRLGRG